MGIPQVIEFLGFLGATSGGYTVDPTQLPQVAQTPPVTNVAAWPIWAPWVLWIVSVALVTVALAEMPKRWIVQKTKNWQTAVRKAEKVRMLLPWLAGIGAVLGAGVFSTAPGIQLALPLSAMLGAGVGVVSFSIYDGVILVIGLIPRFVKKKAGLDTGTNDALSEPAIPPVDGSSNDPPAA